MYFVILCVSLHFIQFNMEKKRSSVDLVFSVVSNAEFQFACFLTQNALM